MDNNQQTNSVGRPATTESEVDMIFRKLEPYLKSGRSLYKACVSVGIPKTRVYDLYNSDDQFAEKIDACRHYRQILADSILLKEVERINVKAGTNPLSPEEIKFLQWVSERQVTDNDSLPHRPSIEKLNYQVNK